MVKRPIVKVTDSSGCPQCKSEAEGKPVRFFGKLCGEHETKLLEPFKNKTKALEDFYVLAKSMTLEGKDEITPFVNTLVENFHASHVMYLKLKKEAEKLHDDGLRIDVEKSAALKSEEESTFRIKDKQCKIVVKKKKIVIPEPEPEKKGRKKRKKRRTKEEMVEYKKKLAMKNPGTGEKKKRHRRTKLEMQAFRAQEALKQKED